mmetsp:Transcript_40438/g.71685  ORF Transcript_40438/g.71685 Transcript_40438/m.71685 type:complete len:216 (-) Transcript_40438:524-1171(-)
MVLLVLLVLLLLLLHHQLLLHLRRHLLLVVLLLLLLPVTARPWHLVHAPVVLLVASAHHLVMLSLLLMVMLLVKRHLHAHLSRHCATVVFVHLKTPLLLGQQRASMLHILCKVFCSKWLGNLIHTAPEVLPERKCNLQILLGLEATREFLPQFPVERLCVALVLEEKLADDAHTCTRQHEGGQQRIRLHMVLLLWSCTHETWWQKLHSGQVPQQN